MALVLGTNCGFVDAAPTADPEGSSAQISNAARAFFDTSPAGAPRITEMGVYINNATEVATIELAIYTDDETGIPHLRFATAASVAKGTDAGWKVVSGLEWDLDPETDYWLAAQCDSTATATNMDNATSGGTDASIKTGMTALPADWDTELAGSSGWLLAIYAVVEDQGGASTILPFVNAEMFAA